eukprot:scaffold61089_cov59-Attheya_sp.AAC.1
MEHVFWAISTARASIMRLLMFPTLKMLSYANDPRNPFSPATTMSPRVRVLCFLYCHSMQIRGEKSLEHWTQCQVLRSLSPAASDTTCHPKYREELEKQRH